MTIAIMINKMCGPISLVVIQTTSFCNLDCDYCYLPSRQFKNTLSLELILPIFKNIFTSRFLGERFTVCWHAGEPLAVPISFYESAFKLIKEVEEKYNFKQAKLRHSYQTNATFINQAWCDFFQKYPIHVGVSIDGPAFIHDAHRKTRTGLGSHAATMRGISYLQKNDISFSCIAVITQESLDYPDEMFNFFWENGITDVGFNIEEIEGINKHSSLEKSGTETKFKAFIERFWQLVTQKNGKFLLREFENICNLIYRDKRLEGTDMNEPFVIISIDNKGNFSTFDPELLSMKSDLYGDFILGNVLNDTFESVLQTEKFNQIYQDMEAGVNLCRNTCEYFGVCGGGAGSNKYWEKQTFRAAETMACKYRIKMITDVILEKLENLLLE